MREIFPRMSRGEVLTERGRKNLSILDVIRRNGPISKTEISNLIGLNVVTVSNYVDDFLRQKLVFEKEFDVSKGGRRPLLLDLNAGAGYALGVGINLMNMIGVVTDLSGRIIHRVVKPKSATEPKDIVSTILEIIGELFACSDLDKAQVRGVGIGIGGVIDSSREKVSWPAKAGYDCHYVDVTVPLKDIVEKEFGVSVSIENDATMACFGEQWLTLESHIANLIYMYSGVGCGLMLNREIYHGTIGCAGEVAIHSDRRPAPNFLERWDADLGILEQYIKVAERQDVSPASGADSSVMLSEIFEMSGQGKSPAVDIVRRAGQRLGIRVAYLVNLLNPQMVIIGGGIEQAGAVLLDEVRAAITEWCYEETATTVKIVPSSLGDDSVALGAASFIIRRTFAEMKD